MLDPDRNGEILWEGSVNEWVRDNAAADPALIDEVRNLKPGESVEVGGGAAARFTVERVSRRRGTHESEMVCSRCRRQAGNDERWQALSGIQDEFSLPYLRNSGGGGSALVGWFALDDGKELEVSIGDVRNEQMTVTLRIDDPEAPFGAGAVDHEKFTFRMGHIGIHHDFMLDEILPELRDFLRRNGY